MVLTLARTAGRARLDLAIVIRMCRSRMSSGHESYFQVVGARPGFRISETAGRRRPSSLRELRSKRQFEQTETQVANVTSRGSQARARALLPQCMMQCEIMFTNSCFFLFFIFLMALLHWVCFFFPLARRARAKVGGKKRATGKSAKRQIKNKKKQ